MIMDFELGKKSGQIPAFGDWDNANDLPITQYFESARQAGLLRFANAAAAHHHPHQYSDNSHISRGARGNGYGGNDVYAADFQKPAFRVVHHRKAQGVNGGGMMNSRSNGDDDECERGRRRTGAGGGGCQCHCCPPHLREQAQQQKQRIKQVDLKHQSHQRTRRSSSSQQLFYTDQKKQFPKHSAIADVRKPPSTATANNVKPVDEDLYKIPPELLLHHSKRKKVLGFFSRCLVPPCTA